MLRALLSAAEATPNLHGVGESNRTNLACSAAVNVKTQRGEKKENSRNRYVFYSSARRYSNDRSLQADICNQFFVSYACTEKKLRTSIFACKFDKFQLITRIPAQLRYSRHSYVVLPKGFVNYIGAIH